MFFEQYAGENGAPDVLINNAGITADALLSSKRRGDHEIPFSNWERVLNVNLTGVFLCARGRLSHGQASRQRRCHQYFLDQPRGERRPDQ
jgi:NAD(P)-dependent dehydrogenase (short-subunit alcohol dehydrogenase family)